MVRELRTLSVSRLRLECPISHYWPRENQLVIPPPLSDSSPPSFYVILAALSKELSLVRFHSRDIPAESRTVALARLTLS